MWINRTEYNNLKSTAENNEHDANLFRRIVEHVKEKNTIIYTDFVIMDYDTWNELANKYTTEDVKLKNMEAELEWYKVKYCEMKMNTEQ